MKILKKILFIFLLYSMHCFSQKADWSVDYSYFFDNTEFAGSSYTVSQTMTGMHFLPSLNISFDKNFKICGGADLLLLSGATPKLHELFPVIYFHYKKNNSMFYAGAFPRLKTISYYSDFLFSDSIQYFRPTLNGLFWKMGNEKNYFNTWLDWTGKQTATTRETFYAGLSAKWTVHSNFFFDLQSYLFHFAKTKPSLPAQHVCDNAQAILTLNYSNKNFIKNNFLKISTGIFTGFERERDGGLQDIPNGFIAQILIENKFGGIDSKLYLGDRRMVLYSKHGNQLYWGNPFLQGEKYSKNQLFINLFNNEIVKAKIGYTLHLAENKVYHEQVLTIFASLEKILQNN